MQFLTWLLLCLAAAIGEATTCTNPRVRKSWLALSNAEKLEYIRAVKCLDTLPSKGNYSAARTRRDDWTAMHIFRSRPTVPSYIPGSTSMMQQPSNLAHKCRYIDPPSGATRYSFQWYYLLSFETALIEECGYKGAQPYWDWTIWTPRNKRKFADSPIFDPTYGFGGNGVGQSSDGKASTGYDSRGGSCVTDGPFANLTLTLGPGYNLSANPHCLKRKFFVLANDTYLGPEMITDVLKEKNYFDMIMAMTKSPDLSNPKRYGVHTTGHIGPGGEEADFWSSPNDPIFVVHHANLDRVWDFWQDQAPENLYAINGPTSMGRGLTRGPGNTTLDDMLEMSPDIAPNLPARALMDSLNKNGKGISCVRYE